MSGDAFSFPTTIFDWSPTDTGEDGTAPAVVAPISVESITSAFAADMSGIHLLPHELRQIRRIHAIAIRDRKRAKAAYLLMLKRARAARVALEGPRRIAA